MKTQIIFFILLLASGSIFAQNCFWAKNAVSTEDETGNNIATDINGNVYVIGEYQSNQLIFGNDTCNATSNYFIAKYSINGDIQWAKSAVGIACAYGIVCDNDGNIYVTGYIDAASTTFGGITLTNSGYGDVFIVKYNSAGDVLWAKRAGGPSNGEAGLGIVADNAGSIYVTGRFTSSTVTFGTIVLTNSYTSGHDLFVAKYDTAGTVIWAKSAGGNRDDYGNGITSYGGDVYITGYFESDSISFDGTTLYTDAAGSRNMIIVKYSSSGIVTWAKVIKSHWGGAEGCDINCDSDGYIYISGEYSGDYITFGSIVVNSVSSGSTDPFLAKYDQTGNALWARSGGSDFYDYCEGMTVDDDNDILIVGTFTSNSIVFGTYTLLNANPGQMDLFIVKYNSGGSILWATRIGNVSLETVWGIDAGIGDNAYFTGGYKGATLSFGNTVLTNTGGRDMYVADIFTFNSGIVSFTNATCNGFNNGTAITTASDGNLPYTYLWSTVPPQTTPDVNNLSAGSYTVTITEGFGCAQTSSVTITEPPTDMASICMVTVDSLSDYNIIIWDKSLFTSVDSVIVYREISTNNYQPIARIEFSEPGFFVDTVSALYFPNTGNPNEGTYRYKIGFVDTCGGYTTLSPYHNTIYVMNIGGVFGWTQLYTIENQPNPVTSYILERDDYSNGNWHAVTSVAGTQQTVSDPLFALYESVGSWRIKTEWSINCSFGSKYVTYSHSLSNVFTNNPTAVSRSNTDRINIFPNPATDMVYINCNENATVEIMNMQGQIVVTKTLSDNSGSSGSSGSSSGSIDVSELRSGVYTLRVKTDKGVVMKKMVKE